MINIYPFEFQIVTDMKDHNYLQELQSKPVK